MNYHKEGSKLISHHISEESMENVIKKISTRIQSGGDKSYVSIDQCLQILEQLSSFDFGRFLLKNQGINGYWTHYMLTFPWFGRKENKNNRGEVLSEVEDFILNRAPTILATQQRFEIFLRENQKEVKNNAKLACIPCGMMGELLYLDFHNINDISLIGIDYDPGALQDAKVLAEHKGLSKYADLFHEDAWNLSFKNEFNLISSNGLNIYEPEFEKVTALFRQFFEALSTDGKLVTSFLTYPPHLTKNCEWNFAEINEADLLYQKIILSDIIEAKWQCYSSSENVKNQLEMVGFRNINIVYDRARMFPTVVAYK